MGTLLKDRHQVPTLCCGSGAKDYIARMEPYHMRLTYVEGEPGTATSIKFIRSITAKGLSCLLFESLQAAQRYGVQDTIVESFLDSFGPGFEKIIMTGDLTRRPPMCPVPSSTRTAGSTKCKTWWTS